MLRYSTQVSPAFCSSCCITRKGHRVSRTRIMASNFLNYFRLHSAAAGRARVQRALPAHARRLGSASRGSAGAWSASRAGRAAAHRRRTRRRRRRTKMTRSRMPCAAQHRKCCRWQDQDNIGTINHKGTVGTIGPRRDNGGSRTTKRH